MLWMCTLHKNAAIFQKCYIICDAGSKIDDDILYVNGEKYAEPANELLQCTYLWLCLC